MFAERCHELEVDEKFDDVIFTDESSIWLERHGKLCFWEKGMPVKLKPKAKHPYIKVHVWAGISKRGATKVIVFTGIMRKEFYVESILRDGLLPFVQETFLDGYRIQQVNDPKHRSKFTTNRKFKIYLANFSNWFSLPCYTGRLAMQFIRDNNINYWPTPAESPDLNPIEMLWHELKCYLRRVVKPRNKDDLLSGIQKILADCRCREVSTVHWSPPQSHPRNYFPRKTSFEHTVQALQNN